jgi:MFS family permease
LSHQSTQSETWLVLSSLVPRLTGMDDVGVCSEAQSLSSSRPLPWPLRRLQVPMAGRFLAGFGVAIFRSAGPAFVTEIAPLQWRGPATLLYNSLWLIGAILASSIAYGSGPMKSSLSWRLPLILQVVPSTIVVVFSLFLPESPRWLVANDRYKEARKLLVKYHAAGDENSPLITLEMAEMRASIR